MFVISPEEAAEGVVDQVVNASQSFLQQQHAHLDTPAQNPVFFSGDAAALTPNRMVEPHLLAEEFSSASTMQLEYPLRDPSDTTPEAICLRVLWFLIILTPLLFTCFVSIFAIGCPACCSCCCFKEYVLEEDEDSDEDGNGSLAASNRRGDVAKTGDTLTPSAYYRFENNPNATRIPVGTMATPPESQALLSKPAASSTTRGSSLGSTASSTTSNRIVAGPQSGHPTSVTATEAAAAQATARLLQQTAGFEDEEDVEDEADVPVAPFSLAPTMKTGVRFEGEARSESAFVEEGGPIRVLSRRKPEGETLETKTMNYSLFQHTPAENQCCRVPKRACPACCLLNLAVWMLGGFLVLFGEFMFWKWYVYDPHFEYSEDTKIVILSSSGGSGHVVAANRLVQLLTEPPKAANATHVGPEAARVLPHLAPGAEEGGWTPYNGGKRYKNLKKEEVEVIYVMPPECKKNETTGEDIVTPECAKRSWLQMNSVFGNMYELMANHLISDFGVLFGRDEWDRAQKEGDMETLWALYNDKPKADFMFGWAFRSNARAYLDKHPNLEVMVTVQYQGTYQMWEAVRDFNQDRRAAEEADVRRPYDRDVHFVIQICDPANPDNFFLPAIKRFQDYSPPSERSFYHMDMSYAGVPFLGIANSAAEVQQFADGTRRYYHEELGFTDAIIDMMRFTDGVIRPEFQQMANKIYLGQVDPAVERTKELRLKKLKNVNGKNMQEDLVVPKDQHVVAIMLGGVAAIAPTLEYVEQSATRTVRKTPDGQYQLADMCETKTIFVFCGGDPDLVKAVMKKEEELKNRAGPGPAEFRQSLRIFALGRQGADVIAPVFARANTLIVRGGGVTAFEVRAVGPGTDLVVHSERAIKPLNHELGVCTKGMLSHEAGNAAWEGDAMGGVVLSDLKKRLRILPDPKKGFITLGRERKGYPCLAPQDEQYVLPFANVGYTKSLGCGP
ncbi:unnamed protein product [Amoebophrya sp. A120]|nr:unnamed protein product [Amoebophrya sp. A120]|eukprot:GSA120T00002239001.1